ncbi:MAG: hypothetical protein ABJQ71_11830 [Roseibium sp.]
MIQLIPPPQHNGTADIQKLHEPSDAWIALTGPLVEMINDRSSNTTLGGRKVWKKAQGLLSKKDAILL